MTGGMGQAELLVVLLIALLIIVGGLALLRRPPVLNGGPPTIHQQSLEHRLGAMPQHSDLRSINERLHTVERTMDIVRTEMRGMTDAVGRVEKMTNLLLEQALEDRKA